MFLHMPTLKKWMKQSWNAGNLIVGNLYDGLIIECGIFHVWLDAAAVPNKVKGAIMELTGELPEADRVFQAGKEGNQYEIPWKERWNIPAAARDGKRYIVTPMVLADDKYHSFRFLQRAGKPEQVFTVSEMLMNLLDPAECDYELGEGTPQGPFKSDHSDIFYWKTGFCILGVCRLGISRGLSLRVMDALKEIDFEGDYSGLEDA